MSVVNITVFGDRDLERKLGKLVDRVQKTIVRQAIRKEAKKTKDRIVANIQRIDLIDTGTMVNAFQRSKIKAGSNNRKIIRIGPEWPTRSELGIAPDDKFYYPTAVEYGHPGAPAYPFVRPAVHEHKDRSITAIGNDIRDGIERAAK
jgi:HK97 gp10 family phage protein